MTLKLTEKQIAFLREPHYCVVATLDAHGRPRQTIVWVDTDGENVLFNTALHRAKARHLAKHQWVSMLVVERGDFYRWLEIQGRAETTEDGAVEHVQQLSQKYDGKAYEGPMDRLLVRVRPEHVTEYKL